MREQAKFRRGDSVPCRLCARDLRGCCNLDPHRPCSTAQKPTAPLGSLL